MHIISDLTDLVDYESSKFYTYYNYTHNLGYVAVNSKQDFKVKKEKIKKDNPEKNITIWAETIKFTKYFDTYIDLFAIGSFDSKYYISEQLKKAILDEKITGCDVRPANNLRWTWLIPSLKQEA